MNHRYHSFAFHLRIVEKGWQSDHNVRIQLCTNKQRLVGCLK
ncbi:hypothetical protein [Paenibacillus campi]|nr:hypothetical protein [Paenibacillus sp. SGZ-1009]